MSPVKTIVETAAASETPEGFEEPTETYSDEDALAQLGWELKMPPDEYLERYPDGKHADLAREIVGD